MMSTHLLFADARITGTFNFSLPVLSMLPMVVSIGVTALMALPFILPVWRLNRALRAQLAAHRRSDHAGQLRAIEELRVSKFNWTAKTAGRAYWFLRGGALYYLGQLTEAEACVRKSLEAERDPHRRALALEVLGSILLEQGLHAEAIATFDDAIKQWPLRGGAHRGIAETLLRQGAPPVDALRWARQAVDIDRNHRSLAVGAGDLNLSEALSTLTWAIARYSGDAAEVDRLLREASILCGEDTKPSLALVNYCAGQAYSALGNPDAASRHFKQASVADPTGNYGRLSAAAESTLARG
jgi:tetratricopeptide (TPR) repeat protein